jgi:hypothetical protein
MLRRPVIGVLVREDDGDETVQILEGQRERPRIDDQLVPRLRDYARDVPIYAPAGAATAAAEFGAITVSPGDTVTAGPFTLTFHGGRHSADRRREQRDVGVRRDRVGVAGVVELAVDEHAHVVDHGDRLVDRRSARRG